MVLGEAGKARKNIDETLLDSERVQDAIADIVKKEYDPNIRNNRSEAILVALEVRLDDLHLVRVRRGPRREAGDDGRSIAEHLAQLRQVVLEHPDALAVLVVVPPLLLRRVALLLQQLLELRDWLASACPSGS